MGGPDKHIYSHGGREVRIERKERTVRGCRD